MTRKAKKAAKAREAERRIARSVMNPVRLDAQSIFIECTASPKEIAKLLQKRLATVSFHVGELLDDDAIEPVKTVQRRGALEHFYKAKERPELSDAEWRALPASARRDIVTLVLRAIVTESLSSLRHGKMDTDEDLQLIWKAVSLDAQGRGEVSELHAEMLQRLEAIVARNATRTPEGEDDIATTRIVAMLTFERSRPGQPASEGFSLNQLEK